MLKKLIQKRSKEEQFWDWFLKNEAELFYGTDIESNRERIFSGLTEKIKAIDSNLTYEFSPVLKDDTKEFIVSADGMKESFEQVKSVISKAPTHDHWIFIAFRQPNSGDDLIMEMGELKIGYRDIYFRFLDEEGELNIELNIRDYDGSGFQQNAVYLLLDSLLGEYDTVKEIDIIDWVLLDETKLDNFYPFIELRNVISNRKQKADNNK
jgi:hypothetical protein